MGRGKATAPEPVLGAHAWAYMRRDPDYRAAWAAHAAPPRFEAGAFPLRVQTGADLAAAAQWALLAWEDPGAAAWRSPFWSGIPMLVGEPDPDPWPDTTALLPLLAAADATVEGRAGLRPAPRNQQRRTPQTAVRDGTPPNPGGQVPPEPRSNVARTSVKCRQNRGQVHRNPHTTTAEARRTSMPQPPDDPSTEDHFGIPNFLDRKKTPRTSPPAPPQPPSTKRTILPPDSMMPVLRAIRTGKTTIQQFRASLGGTYPDKDLHAGLDALIRINTIQRIGRQYVLVQYSNPLPPETPPA